MHTRYYYLLKICNYDFYTLGPLSSQEDAVLSRIQKVLLTGQKILLPKEIKTDLFKCLVVSVKVLFITSACQEGTDTEVPLCQVLWTRLMQMRKKFFQEWDRSCNTWAPGSLTADTHWAVSWVVQHPQLCRMAEEDGLWCPQTICLTNPRACL